MKKTVLVAMTAALLASGAAMAQTVVIAPEQRTHIKEYVVKEKIRPVTIKERVAVGTVLPGDVELVTVPTAWGPTVQQYRYVYWDNHVVFVDPSSRRVVQILD